MPMVAENRSELDRRRHALLCATVQDFIASAEPVGSQQIAARYALGVRAASVRSMMAELEDEGYLTQPHTSAGRVPTDKAFRYYVDHLTPSRGIGREDRAQIEFRYSERRRDLAEVMRETSRLLAAMTGQAALVLAPRLESVVLERVSFVRTRAHEVLALFVAAAGRVQNRLLQTDRDYQQEELDRMAGYLNERLHGQTLEAVRVWIERELHEEQARFNWLIESALRLGKAIATNPAPAELYIEGSAKALTQPEFADLNRLREMLRVLEDKSALLQLLERSLTASGQTVSIGSENFDSRLSDLSVIVSSYDSGAMPLGCVAVVGPMRMDYNRLIPLVDYTAKALSRLLDS